MCKKCLAWKSGVAGAIAREKMTIFWLGKPRGVFVSEFCNFGVIFTRNYQKPGFPAVSRHSGAISELAASKLVEISAWVGLRRFSNFPCLGNLFAMFA